MNSNDEEYIDALIEGLQMLKDMLSTNDIEDEIDDVYDNPWTELKIDEFLGK